MIHLIWTCSLSISFLYALRSCTFVFTGWFQNNPELQILYPWFLESTSLTHFIPLVGFFTPWKHQKNKRPLAWIELKERYKGLDHFYLLLFLGSWSVQTERGGGLIVLRSLHWLGLTFYHVPGSAHYGYVYVGLGEKNLDLPFML